MAEGLAGAYFIATTLWSFKVHVATIQTTTDPLEVELWTVEIFHVDLEN